MERRVWILWAIALTAISAVVTVRLVRLRRFLNMQLEQTAGGGADGRLSAHVGGGLLPIDDVAGVGSRARVNPRETSASDALRLIPAATACLAT